MNTGIRGVIAAVVLIAATERGHAEPVRTPAGSLTLPVVSADQEPYSAGDTVEVSWTGSWYTAEILAVRAGEYRVHYIGWESNWDEWVKPGRIRSSKSAPAAKGATAPKQPAKPGKVWSTRPEGRYSCTTFDAGQLNRIAEIKLESGGKYSELLRGGAGRYDYNATTHRVRFLSGPQKTNAPVTFDATARDGKGWLMFDYGNGAKLHCYREALK